MREESLTSNSLGIPADSNRPGNPLEFSTIGSEADTTGRGPLSRVKRPFRCPCTTITPTPITVAPPTHRQFQ